MSEMHGHSISPPPTWLILSMLLFSFAPFVFAQRVENPARSILRSIFRFSADNLAAVDRGEIVTRPIHSDSISEDALAGAAYLSVPFSTALARIQAIDTSGEKRQDVQIVRLHTPPIQEDFRTLRFELSDLDALRNCAPGNCEVKLPASVMHHLQKDVNWNSSNRREEETQLLKRWMLTYIRSYEAVGAGALAEYDDQAVPRRVQNMLGGMLLEQPNLFAIAPQLYTRMNGYPNSQMAGTRDVMYWERDAYSGIKPTVSLHHLTIYRREEAPPLAVVADCQIYANHYFEGSITITALMSAGPNAPGSYLLYLKRSCFDDLRKTGFFSFSADIRKKVEQQMQSELRTLVGRLKSKNP